MPAQSPRVHVRRTSAVGPSPQKESYEFWNTIKGRNQPRGYDGRRTSISGSSVRSGQHFSPPQKQIEYIQPRVEYVQRPAEYYQPQRRSADYVGAEYYPRRKSVEYVGSPIVYPVDSQLVQRPTGYAVPARRVSVENVFAAPYGEGSFSSKQYVDSTYYERTVVPSGPSGYQTRYGYEASTGVLVI